MLFIDFEQGRRLRLQRMATIREQDELLAAYPGDQFIVRVQVTEVYNNYPRYIHMLPPGGTVPVRSPWRLRARDPGMEIARRHAEPSTCARSSKKGLQQ